MKLEFKLQSLILTSVITTIVITVAGLTWLVYSRLYETIMDGFERKLAAVSTVTSTFLDARTHERILAPRRIEALAFDSGTAALYGADSSFDAFTLVKIDLSDTEPGAAEAIAFLERLPISMTDSGQTGSLLGLVVDGSGNSTLVEINLEDGTMQDRRTLPEGSRSIVYHAPSETIYVGGNGLYRITKDATDPELVPGTETLTFDELCLAGDGAVVGFERPTLSFFRVDLETGNAVASQFIPRSESGEGLGQTPPLGLAAQLDEGRILVAAERLRYLSPDTLEWLPTGKKGENDLVFGFRSEQAAIYRSFVEPMRRIRTRKDLTFLYSQTLSDTDKASFEGSQRSRMDLTQANQIIYILDSNTDDIHSEIGKHDTENEANEAIRDVYFKGKQYLSPIEIWETWGPVKSGFAPILEDDGRVVAMAGADVAVGKIQAKTKIALLIVTLTGVGAILGGSLVSFQVARKLTEPIEAIKEVALRIAAGQFGEEIEAPKLVELSQLSESFNTMSRTLKSTVSGLQETNRDWEVEQQNQELVRFLTLRDAELDRYRAWVELLEGDDPHERPSGWTNRGSLVWGWMIDDQGSRAANLRFRVELATFLYHLSRDGDAEVETMEEALRIFLGEAPITLFLIDLESRAVHFFRHDRPTIWTWDASSETSSHFAIEEDTFTLDSETQYVFCAQAKGAEDLDLWMRCRAADDVVNSLKIQMSSHDTKSGEAGDRFSGGIAVRIGKERRESE